MPIPVSRSDEALVTTTVDVFLRYPGADQDIILYALTRKGIEPAMAWKLWQFVPIAFFHVMYRGSGISSTSEYVSLDFNTQARIKRSLLSEPLYAAAVRAAERQASESSGNLLNVVASHSGEFDLVRQYKTKSDDLSGFTITEHVLVEYDEDWFLRSSDEVNQILKEAFVHHGTTPSLDHGWLVFPGTQVRVNGYWYETSSSEKRATVDLGIRVCLDSESMMIVESFSGWGVTEKSALDYAYSSFFQSTFHVILSALLGGDVGEQVAREEWTIDGLTKIATVGGITFRAATDLASTPDAFRWYGQLQQEIQTRGVGSGTHWVRLFRGQANRSTVALEVLLDNEPWESVQRNMASAPWPAFDGFYTMRLFLMLQDPSPPKTPEPD